MTTQALWTCGCTPKSEAIVLPSRHYARLPLNYEASHSSTQMTASGNGRRPRDRQYSLPQNEASGVIMVHRPRPTLATAPYASLISARPSAATHRLSPSDRIAVCPSCSDAHRIDVNDVLYTHLNGQTQTVGVFTDWLLCPGTGQRVVLSPKKAAIQVVPNELVMSIRGGHRDNLVRIRRIEDQIQMLKDWMLKADEFDKDRYRARIREHSETIDWIKAENELLWAALEVA